MVAFKEVGEMKPPYATEKGKVNVSKCKTEHNQKRTEWRGSCLVMYYDPYHNKMMPNRMIYYTFTRDKALRVTSERADKFLNEKRWGK